MERRNIECKARDDAPAATAVRCVALGAQDRGVLHQRDTYFAGARGRLKLRDQGPAGSQLIAYRRPDGAEPRQSAYVLAPVAEPEELRAALCAALDATVVVVKRRHLFVWEDVRIHLDEVEGLGSFVELEAVLPDDGDGDGGADVPAAQAKIERLRAELAIADDALVPVGYADLLLDGAQALLRAADGAMRRAYAPYSRFKVGAAVRGRSGAIYAGANVENASYPLGNCAEPAALSALVAAGESAITAAAVVAERVDRCPPCGGCRQRLAEFGGADTPVYLGRPGADPLTIALGELLPLAFGREELGR
jgi:homotetrameric cytidine deaminase